MFALSIYVRCSIEHAGCTLPHSGMRPSSFNDLIEGESSITFIFQPHNI